MRAGAMRYVVTLERRDDAPRNDYGERPETWSAMATVRASIEPIRGREYMTSSSENAELTHRLRVRHSSVIGELRPRDRAVYGSRIFDIQSVIIIDSGNRMGEIMVVERVTD